MTDERRVKEVYPDMVVDEGLAFDLFGVYDNPTDRNYLGGGMTKTDAFAAAASRLPKANGDNPDNGRLVLNDNPHVPVTQPFTKEVTADDEPEIFALINLHRANVEASSSPEAKQAFLDTMGFLLELAKVRHAAKASSPDVEGNGARHRVKSAFSKAQRDTRDLRTEENGGACPDCNRDKSFCICSQKYDAAKTSSPAVGGGESEAMPVFLAAYLRSINPTWAQQIWDWVDGTPDAIFQIIDIVASIARESLIKDVRGKE